MRALFWQRAVSALIDLVLGSIVGGIWSLIIIVGFLARAPHEVIEAVRKQGGTVESTEMLLQLPFSLRVVVSLTVLGSCFYYLTEALLGWSIGKKILGLRIRNADGSYLDVGKGVARWAIKSSPAILSSIAIILPSAVMINATTPWQYVVIVGWFMILLPGGTALHDRISGTAVFSGQIPRNGSKDGRLSSSHGRSGRSGQSYDA